MSDILEIIKSVGFPIACCVALFWYMERLYTAHNEIVKSVLDFFEKIIMIDAEINHEGENENEKHAS